MNFKVGQINYNKSIKINKNKFNKQKSKIENYNLSYNKKINSIKR